jgi:hypothetical protein
MGILPMIESEVLQNGRSGLLWEGKISSSIFPSQTVDAGSIVAWSILQGNRRMTISLKNIGLISHFAKLQLKV